MYIIINYFKYQRYLNFELNKVKEPLLIIVYFVLIFNFILNCYFIYMPNSCAKYIKTELG